MEGRRKRSDGKEEKEKRWKGGGREVMERRGKRSGGKEKEEK
jgi:hypothetical protein